MCACFAPAVRIAVPSPSCEPEALIHPLGVESRDVARFSPSGPTCDSCCHPELVEGENLQVLLNEVSHDFMDDTVLKYYVQAAALSCELGGNRHSADGEPLLLAKTALHAIHPAIGNEAELIQSGSSSPLPNQAAHVSFSCHGNVLHLLQ